MKLYTEKINAWLLKYYRFGILLLLISGFWTYLWLPVIFFSQETGIVKNIEETTEWVSTGFGRTLRQYRSDVFVFTIDGEKYFITRTEKNSDRLLGLLGREITFRYHSSKFENKKSFREIIYDGKVIVDSEDYKNRQFIFGLVLFLLSLSWCVRVFVLK